MKEYTLSRRKSSAAHARREDYAHTHRHDKKESNTIDFNQAVKTQLKQVQLVPKTRNQEKYVLALLDQNIDIVVAGGPAGTGKTYLAMIAAIKALKLRQCERIILTRPAVGVDDEKHGFLPGDLNAKMEPWTRPLLDVLREYYHPKEIVRMLEEQIVEIAPLAFCRGRNFKNSWVVLDEAQNATPSQMKMIMTRIGVGSKIVITGDVEQADRKSRDNGLMDLEERLKTRQIPGLAFCNFDLKDVQRHSIIEHVIRAYQ